MPQPRVFYFCPDFPQPSGGVRTLYHHVTVLRDAGVDATVVHQKRGFVADWHGYSAPVIWLEDRPRFEPSDTLVFPEVMADFVRQTQSFGGHRIVFALSWAPAYSRLKAGERWADLGVDLVMAQSRTVQRTLMWSLDTPVAYVPPFVDPVLYFPASKPTPPNVSYMTRKDRAGEWLQGVLTRRGRGGLVGWTPLQNLAERDYAAALRAATVYVPTTTQEGLHVSILEAMACGCLVVGFSGIGGEEYMVGEGDMQNCLLIPNGDLLALGTQLEDLLAGLASDAQAYAGIQANGLATAAVYQDADAQRDTLLGLLT